MEKVGAGIVKKYEIYDIEDIDTILDYIHDRFFEIDQITFDKESQRLRIPISIISTEGRITGKILWLIKQRTHLVVSAALLIHEVVDYELLDEAKTGEGDINTILFDGDTVIIECGLPVTIRIKVVRLHLELEITDETVGEKKFFSWR